MEHWGQNDRPGVDPRRPEGHPRLVTAAHQGDPSPSRPAPAPAVILPWAASRLSRSWGVPNVKISQLAGAVLSRSTSPCARYPPRRQRSEAPLFAAELQRLPSQAALVSLQLTARPAPGVASPADQ